MVIGKVRVRMNVEDGKIVEATESELFDYYLTHGWDDIMSFPDYLEKMKNAGVKIAYDKK